MSNHRFVPVDTGFSDLTCPAMHGGYHHISALTADSRSLEHTPAVEIVIVGSLCESGDVFTQ